jgi:formylglycine-generating enzyme required for sulfatase activity
MATDTDPVSESASVPTPTDHRGVDGMSSTLVAGPPGNNLPSDPLETNGLASTVRAGRERTGEPLQRGDSVGRYLVLGRVGHGGMGVVYSAHDPDLDRKVALKLLLLENRTGSEGSVRLLREAQALARLSHPNVVAVHDVGTLADRVWIAMEFVEGHTIGTWLKEKRRPWRAVLAVFLQAGEGLQAAHEAGFVHRDFKPENVMMTPGGRVKVMDFGLARVERTGSGEAASRSDTEPRHQDVLLTRTGDLLGTPRYMAPEQWDGTGTDGRTDQFSFCVALWEALYGETPFVGDTIAEIALSVKQGRLKPTPEGSGVPVWLRKIVLRGLQVDPAARWATMKELLRALHEDPTRRNRLLWAAVLLTIMSVGAALAWSRELARRTETIASLLEVADEDMKAAREAIDRAMTRRGEAFRAFDVGKAEFGEELWTQYLADVPTAEEKLAQVTPKLESALSLDGSREDVRAKLLDALLERARMTELAARGELAVKEQVERLRVYDLDGEHVARWDAPGILTVRTEPLGARVLLERYVDERGRLKPAAGEALGATPTEPRTLAHGSYRLRLELEGRAPVLYPVLLARAEELVLDIVLPTTSVPDGFVYVPAGRFLYGAECPEVMRGALYAEPLHQVETGAYLIAALEVTFADYIEFLEALPADRRRELIGAGTSETLQEGVRLSELSGGGWQLEIHQGTRAYSARSDQELVYEGRTRRERVPWAKLPVTGLSFADAELYMNWLDSTGRVPGARFCTEYEWERAARGADGRSFAHGARLDPTDANFSATYGRVSSAFGPDPVGSYSHTTTPFGLYDTVGNAYEMTVPQHKPDTMVVRGGAYFYDAWGARADNRFEVGRIFRHSTLGLRVCATWPPPGR